MDYSVADLEKVDFRHELKVQVRFNDLDIFGHVNNAIQFCYFDFGKSQYLSDINNAMTDWEDIVLVMVNVNTDYLHPIYLGDNITVKTKITSVGNKSVKFQQIIYDQDDKTIRSVCHSVMCAFSRKQKVSVPVPEEWRKKIMDFETK